jgi:hypothetical protein
MGTRKKIVATVAAVIIFSLGNATQAQADFSGDFAPSNWTYSETNASAEGPSGTLTTTQMQLTSADWPQLGTPVSNTTASYTILIPASAGMIAFNYHYVTNDRDGSSYDLAKYTLNGVTTNIVRSNISNGGSETGTITLDTTGLWGTNFVITQACTDCVLGTATITITEFYGGPKPVRNALRLDTQGVTTEKNNVVSCTPGKYTFLNGGSTAETAKIQSYVYTLLVNGKAVSTLSTDGFKSVPSHLFPTIAGNMAGTATLEGATWDLKGMSNYSAACQVYATQSGGNTQSVTTEVHDSVALAAAAEAAAKAQMAKDMIATWASDEDLAKKYRDNRLAGKP